MLKYLNFPDTPLGDLSITHDGSQLLSLRFQLEDHSTGNFSVFDQRIQSAVTAYLDLPTYAFDLSFKLLGTPFQQSVWQALLEIPLGQTLTYGGLAKKLNTSARAIGNACRNNPLPLIIPCHRIVAANGLGGYCGAVSGDPIQNKCWLLKREGAKF